MYDDDDEFTGGPLDHVARWTLYLIASLVVVGMATALWVSFAQARGTNPAVQHAPNWEQGS